jgi:hypothetical protein
MFCIFHISHLSVSNIFFKIDKIEFKDVVMYAISCGGWFDFY